MIGRLFALALAGAVAASAAHAAPPLKPGAFVSDKSHNYFGYYSAKKPAPVFLGKWTLDTIAIGPPRDFANFEAGRMYPDNDGVPVKPFSIGVIEAHPAENATADEVEALPVAYNLTGNTVSFTSGPTRLGVVRFDGTFTPAFMKAIATKAGPKRGDTVVLTGTLVVGTTKVPLQLTWYDGGDD